MQSRDESRLSRGDLVVLACLSQSKPPNDDALGDALQELALPRESVSVARHRAADALARFVALAWVNGEDAPPKRRGSRKAPPARTLTDAGKRVLRDAFHLPRVPSWAQVRDKHLPALGVAMSPAVRVAGGSLTESALTAAVLGARFGVSDAATTAGLCDALIAKALGMQPGKLTLDRIRAHMLLRGVDPHAAGMPVPDTKGYAVKLGGWIASTAVGATGTTRKMARAFARRWVSVEGPVGMGESTMAPASARLAPVVPLQPSQAVAVDPARHAANQEGTGNGKSAIANAKATGGGAASTGPTKPQAPAQPLASVQPAPELLDVVRDAIPRIGAEGRFGEKVYVSAIWRSIERERAAKELSLDRFKHWLVSANRNGWLVLARADLIGAMDVRQVNDSEINDRGATFHFVLDQRNTASAAQRGSHAG